MQQKTYRDPDAGRRGEAPDAGSQGAETVQAPTTRESPSSTAWLMEAICEPVNLRHALKRVKANKGAAGADGMSVSELPDYLRHHWPELKAQLLSGSYRPSPVRRVTIPKPGGGERLLGIPTVVDRFIQQAMMQVLQAQWDATFSDSSYGFRPGRSAHQAVKQAQKYIESGYSWGVDLDLEKFFDRVNHDVLMSRIAKRVSDKRVLSLIRGYPCPGEHELVSEVVEAGQPAPASVMSRWVAGAGYAVCLDFISDRPVRRWSEERKAAVRRRNLEKRINRHAPLFADELIARELAERPDYFQGK
ncbi:TPA: hypothetical protein OT528_004646 [Escherichia coli]|nr:hypothetical protein [Escherichia coli]